MEQNDERAVVFFDVDGTLISDETGIMPASTHEAIQKLRERGHIPVVNTGRPYTHVVPPVKALPIRDYVCSCGMFILKDGVVIQDHKPSREVCVEMRDLVLSCDIDCIFEGSDTVYYTEGKVRTFDFSRGIDFANGLKLSRDIMDADFHFDKLTIWHNESSDYERFVRGAEKYFSMIIRDPHFTELVAKGYSKGNGIRRYLDSFERRPKVYAFGDGPNDVEMFRAADVKVLMGSGDMSLRGMADYVTDTVDNDGIFKALKHFGLI